MSESIAKKILCSTHGKQPWTGQVICTGCQHVWHLNVDSPPTSDGSCTCGVSLVGANGSARAICPDCYEQRKTGLS